MKRLESCLTRGVLLMVIMLCISSIANAQFTPLPYFNGFENPQDTAGWTFKKRPKASGFEVGSAAHCLGYKSMYISPDSGATATYVTTSSGYVTIAYKSFTLPQGSYTLAFDYQMGGDGSNQDMKVAWVPSSTSLAAASIGNSYPNSIVVNQFTDAEGNNTFGMAAWKHVTGTITVPAGGGTYNLCFAFRCNSWTVMAPGACVDNIQIDTVRGATDCVATPTDITVIKDAQAGVTVCWNGNAAEYEVIAASASNPDDYSYTVHDGITTTCDTFQYGELGEGQYFFYVRPICGADTGIYGETYGHLIYDVFAHCIDFITFDAPGTQCTYGTYTNPYQTNGYIDNGPSQMSSRHTVHTDLNETDPRTNNGLHTIPPGEMMSVRLGNWNNGSEAESITYTYNVPAGSNLILMMKYAVVFEEPGHDEPPEFKIEIMNANNQLLDSVCTKVNPSCNGTLTQGWCTCTSGYSSIWYKDWTTIGVNLTPYAGQTVKIRITNADCNWSGHFGYAYFTLNCSQAEFTGMSCGSGESAGIKAPDGFNYQWTNNCTGQVVSTAQRLPITETDTCSYTCRCTNVEQPGCYFELTVYNNPRLPEASFTYTLSYSDCQTHVSFTNDSYIYVLQNGQKTVLPNEKLTSQTWTVKSKHTGRSYHNRTSTAKNLSAIDIPKEGDTLTITLTSWANGCDDDTVVTIPIPALHGSRGVTSRYVCVGTPVVFNRERYTFISSDSIEIVASDGTKRYITGHKSIQVIDTLDSWCGCDSILQLNLSAMITDTIYIDTIIYSDDNLCITAYDVNGKLILDTCLASAGHHDISVPSSLGSCDTLLYVVDLTVIDISYLSFIAENGPATVCLNKSGNPYDIYLKYSTDYCNTWSPYTIGQSIQLQSGERIFFSANGANSNFSSSATDFYYFSIGGKVSAKGNIMSLLDENMVQTTVPQNAFNHLFQECVLLTSAPSLPATVLGDNCYASMFAGCVSLSAAPDLPAWTLAAGCYSNMFERCAQLEVTPNLPASALASECYMSMFNSCISILKAPELPAMLLAENCYNSMFKNCTSLTNVPVLQASALTDGCYSQMFMGCTSLSVSRVPPGTAWQIPSYAVAPDNDWNNDMFANTGGHYTGNPAIGVTYYIASDTITAVDDIYESLTDVILWPNPIHAGDAAYITINEDMAIIEIYTLQGQCIKRIEKASDPVAVGGLSAAGIYIVKVTKENGESKILKLIVE